MQIRSMLTEHKNVVWALFNREIKTRFGDSYFGWAWILLEPMLHIAIFWFLFQFIRHKDSAGMPMLLFLLTGIVPFFLFSKSVKSCLKVIQANKGLLNYRQVKLIDAVFTRIFLETVISTIIFISGLLVLLYIGDGFTIYHPLRIIFCFLVIIILSFGIGLIFAVCGYYYLDLDKFIAPVMRALYFTSGVFFSIDVLPPLIKKYLLYNPIFQIIEYIRSSFSMAKTPNYLSYEYVTIFSFLCLAFGIAIYFITRNNLMMNNRSR